MIRKIHLHILKDKPVIELDCNSPALMLSGLESAIPGFRRELIKNNEIYLVKQNNESYKCIDEDTFLMPLGDSTDIHIIPKIQGSGIETALAIAAYVGATGAAYYAVATIAFIAMNVAAAYVLSAVSGMLAPSPKASSSERADETPSFIFNGSVNVVEEGYPVPLVYGEIITGSIVISAASETEDMITIPEFDFDYYTYIPF